MLFIPRGYVVVIYRFNSTVKLHYTENESLKALNQAHGRTGFDSKCLLSIQRTPCGFQGIHRGSEYPALWDAASIKRKENFHYGWPMHPGGPTTVGTSGMKPLPCSITAWIVFKDSQIVCK